MNEWARRGEHITLLTINLRDRDFYPLDNRAQRVDLGLNISATTWQHSVANNARRISLLRAFARSYKFDVMVGFCDKTNVLCAGDARAEGSGHSG